MTKIILKAGFILVSLFTSQIQAQEFHGQAIYESKMSMSGISFPTKEMTDDMKQKMEERMKKVFERTYVLDFNKTESVFYQEVKLEAPSANSAKGIRMVASTDAKRYKNVKEKVEISEEDIFGKEFLVQDSLPNWNWKLESETKKIGNYLCYKAVSIKPVSDEDKKEYEESKKDKADGKTSLFDVREPKEQVLTVWYAPEIAISQGPEKYWGLPGLILEANDGKTSFLCSKIVLNPKEKTEIKRPKKGKKINRKEFEEITEKKLESMKDANGIIHINASGR